MVFTLGLDARFDAVLVSREKLPKLLNPCGLGLTKLDQRGSNAVPLGTPFPYYVPSLPGTLCTYDRLLRKLIKEIMQWEDLGIFDLLLSGTQEHDDLSLHTASSIGKRRQPPECSVVDASPRFDLDRPKFTINLENEVNLGSMASAVVVECGSREGATESPLDFVSDKMLK